MMNIKHERFDVVKRGVHTLLQIPRFAAPEDTLLRAEGLVRNFMHCSTQFIKRVNVTGQWVEAVHKGGRVFDADVPNTFMLHRRTGRRKMKFGPVWLRVDYEYSRKGFGYLNFRAGGLGDVQSPIGGILGLDGHEYAAELDCKPAPQAPQLSQLGAEVGTDLPMEDGQEVVDEDDATGSIAVATLS